MAYIKSDIYIYIYNMLKSKLVGGCTNPIEQNTKIKLEIFPKVVR